MHTPAENPWPEVKHSSLSTVCRGTLMVVKRGVYVEIVCSGCKKPFGVIDTAVFKALWPDYFRPR